MVMVVDQKQQKKTSKGKKAKVSATAQQNGAGAVAANGLASPDIPLDPATVQQLQVWIEILLHYVVLDALFLPVSKTPVYK